MYSFILLMVLIGRYVRSEFSLTTVPSSNCNPRTLFTNMQSDFQLRDQISNLSERVHELQSVLSGAIDHYGRIVSIYCRLRDV